MELFKITCVTCRARLSVRDAALIGKIIGCPKCGMMVQVTAPAEQDAPAAPPPVVAASTAASPPSESLADAFADVPDVTPPAVASTARAENAPTFEEVADVTSAASSIEPPPTPPAPPQTAARTVPYKLIALSAGGAIAGSAIVAAALSWFTADAPQVAVAPIAKNEAELKPTEVEIPPAPAGETAEDLVDLIAPSGDDSDPEAAPRQIVPPESVEEETKTVAIDPPTAPEAPPEEQDPPAEEAAEIVEAKSPVEEAPEPRLRIDPLDVDPEGINLSTLYGGPPKDPLAESHLPAEEEPAPSVPAEEPNADGAAPPAAAEAVRRDAQAGVGAPADAAALLARKLPAIKFNKTPLCRLLDLAVQVSGMPVSVSPAELRMAAVSAATPASVDAKDATVETLLSEALKPLRLQPVVEGEQIVLKRSGEDKQRTVDYAVDDLAATPAKVNQLGEWVQQLAAPDAWKADGGEAALSVTDGKLHVEAPESVQYEVLYVLERYRITQEKPTRTKYPAALFASGAFHASVAERLAAPAVFTFAHYTPLREIFRYWQEELDVAVLVDWPALAEERLWPNARIACSSADKSWAETMDSVLAPMGLGWRAVGRNTIEITTLSRIREELMLEVYRVAAKDSVDADQLVARIEALAAEGAEAPDGGAVFYDPDSRVLLVRESAAVHRKLIAELSDLLKAPAVAPK